MKGKMIGGHPDVPLTVGELLDALKTYPRTGRVTVWTYPGMTPQGPTSGLFQTEIVGLARTGTNTDHPELETSEALRHVREVQPLHYCAGPSCPGGKYPASEIAHPHWHTLPTRAAALWRFADARRALRCAYSAIDTVCDDGESIWRPQELLLHVLDATAALKEITDVAEHVTGKPLLGTGETLDQALDAIGAELLKE